MALDFLSPSGGGGTSLQGGSSGTGDQKTSFTGGAKFSSVGAESDTVQMVKYSAFAVVGLVVVFILMRKR